METSMGASLWVSSRESVSVREVNEGKEKEGEISS